LIIGIDIGGTFTDFTAIDEADPHRIRIHKRLTTPDDPARAVLDGLIELGAPPDAIIVHGSTIATNALLERKGARTALITTRGFADVIEIGRQNRPQLYALEPAKPEPLVPRELRFELNERVAADGSILQPLDPVEVRALIDQLLDEHIESVAICFLFSFLYPDHEQLVKRAVLAFSSSPLVSLSSELLPEYREYERTSTTVINAYVAPLIARYLDRLEAKLGGRRLRIMQSNGGVISAATAASQAARTALSGPAGGIVGAFNAAQQTLTPSPLSRRAGEGLEVRAISFDMGGTSTDVALCDGALPTTTEGEIAGLPLRLPIMDIHTVGAGGGSIARIDAGGALIVGPQSAGADPGPACYGRGGTQPTVTDANLVLGRLDADHFLGGQMRLDLDAAQRAVASLSAFDIQHSALAWGILRVANATMERAIRKISVERGHDPRRFTLVAFGGAGPLHACELADALGIPRVLVPPSPGVLSALGMATADTITDYSRAVLRRADEMEEVDSLFVEMESRGREDLLAEGIAEIDIVLQRALDLRYVGQSYEITVQQNSDFSEKSEFLEAFHQQHGTRYGHRHPDRAVEIVTARVKAIGRARPIASVEEAEGHQDASEATLGNKPVWLADDWIDTDLYERDRLRAGHVLRGPAIVFQFDTTTAIPPGWVAKVDRLRNLLLAKT
jgi:N-methylhydantoinase A